MQKGQKISAISISNSPDSPRKLKITLQTPKHKHTSSLITPKSSTIKLKTTTTFSFKFKAPMNKFESPSSTALKLNSKHKYAFSEHIPITTKNSKSSKKKLSTSPDKQNSLRNISLPITPETALRLFRKKLTLYEQSEIGTYESIYYLGNIVNKIKATMVNNFGFDDDTGDYKIITGDHIAYRFEIKSILGQGSFGQVVKVYDHKDKIELALKIIKNRPRFHQQAHEEIEILSYLKNKDSENIYCVVHMQENFEFRSHMVILK